MTQPKAMTDERLEEIRSRIKNSSDPESIELLAEIDRLRNENKDVKDTMNRWIELYDKIQEVKMLSDDKVNHPSHYNMGKIEVIEAIEDWKLEFHLGNAVKYIARAGRKNPDKTVEDLEKAIWYLRRFIEIQKENPRRPNDMPQERVK